MGSLEAREPCDLVLHLEGMGSHAVVLLLEEVESHGPVLLLEEIEDYEVVAKGSMENSSQSFEWKPL